MIEKTELDLQIDWKVNNKLTIIGTLLINHDELLVYWILV